MSNLLLAPNTPSTSGLWSLGSGSGVTTEGLSGAPDGTSTQFSMTDADGTAVTNRGQSITIPSNTLRYRFLYWVKKAAGPITNVPFVDLRFGATRFHSVCLDPSNGSTIARTGGSFTAPAVYGALDVGTHYVLYILADNVSETAIEVRIGAAFAAAVGPTADIASTGSATFWGGRFEQTSEVPALPVAAWSTTPSPAHGNDDEDDNFYVEFLDESTGTPTSWAWNFGDAVTSTSQNPSHTYTGVGRYTVALTATNIFGAATTTVTYNVWVTGAPAEFPCIAYDNLLRSADATVTASTQDTGFEVENSYDWRPYTWWKPTATGDSYIEMSFADAVPATAFCLYAHDIGTNGATVQLKCSLNGGTTWIAVTQPLAPAGTEVIYKRFDQLLAAKWRIYVNNPGALSRIGCAFIGLDLELERGSHSGFGPPAYNRQTVITNTTSQGGVWLGRSLQYNGAMVALNPDFLTEDFIRDNWMPFVEHAELYPWFLLWDQTDHVDEAAWCFSTGQIPGSTFTKPTLLNAGIKAEARVE